MRPDPVWAANPPSTQQTEPAGSVALTDEGCFDKIRQHAADPTDFLSSSCSLASGSRLR
jgi:hypothetical protein